MIEFSMRLDGVVWCVRYQSKFAGGNSQAFKPEITMR